MKISSLLIAVAIGLAMALLFSWKWMPKRRRILGTALLVSSHPANSILFENHTPYQVNSSHFDNDK